MSILNVNKINPVGGGSTITIAGIASVTNNLTIDGTASISSNLTAGGGINVTSGSVGINTVSGNEKLDVFGAIRVSGSSAEFNAGLQGALVDYDLVGNAARFGHVNGASGSAKPVVFVSGGTERLRIGSAGQLGIGGAIYGSSGQVLTSQGSGSAVQWATPSSGLSHTQQWYLTANGNTPGNTDNVLPTDSGTWQKQNQSQAGSAAGTLGSDMTYDGSGVFAFPVTGIWKIEFYGYWGISASDSDHNLRSYIQTTTNGGSSYTAAQEQVQSIKSDSTYTYQGWFQTFVFDVTNTSNCKVRFVLNPSCLLYTSPSPRDLSTSRMPSSA